MRDGGLPGLDELRLHNGTIWRWNRPIYDPGDGGHLRIEMRALPSGPTPLDMMASAAFLIGISIGLRDRIDQLIPAFPFEYAEYNFYRAAQFGLLELTCALVYAVPRTVELGAVLLTGYLGGAVATHVRIEEPFVVPLAVGAIAWAGLYLRDDSVRAMVRRMVGPGRGRQVFGRSHEAASARKEATR